MPAQIVSSPLGGPTLSPDMGIVSASSLGWPATTNGTSGSSYTPITQTTPGTEMLFMPTPMTPLSPSPLPTESPIVSLLIDTSFTPTSSPNLEIVQVSSSHRYSGTGHNSDATGSPTLGPQLNSNSQETTHVIVVVVAVVGIITLLVSITMTIIYCCRSRSTSGIATLGGAKPARLPHMFHGIVTKIKATAIASTVSIGNLVSRVLKPTQPVWSLETGRTIPSLFASGNTYPSHTTPLISTPGAQITSLRPEKTQSVFLYDRSPSIPWEVKLKEDSLPVPGDFALTRSPSVNTSASKSDPENSPMIVDDGEPLPEPPPRLRRTTARSMTGTTQSLYTMTNRHSLPTSFNFHTMSTFYGIPGGDSSYNTASESPVSNVPFALSPTPPVQAFTLSRRQTREEKGKTPARYERVMSLHDTSVDTSHYNNLQMSPSCMHESRANNYFCRSQDPDTECSPSPGYGADHPIRKLPYGSENISQRHVSSMKDFRSPRTEEFLDTFPVPPERRWIADAALLADKPSLTRQSSIRGSGSVNCSKPSLVSVHASRHGSEENVEIAAGQSIEEERDDWPSVKTLSRAGSQYCTGPLQPIPKRDSVASVANLVSGNFGKQRCISGTETLSSCATTGSSILYHFKGAFDAPVSGGEHSSSQPDGFCLNSPHSQATLLENTSSDTFGKSSASTKSCPRLVPGEFNFPLPWTHDLCIPQKPLLGNSRPLSTTAGACTSNRVSTSSISEAMTNLKFSSSRIMRLPVTTPSLPAKPDADEDVPLQGISGYMHTPSIDVLIHQLKQRNKVCSCNCSSSSSLYSTSTFSNPIASENVERMGHSTNSSGSSDYLPPPSARDSVAQYLIMPDVSSTTLRPPTPETTISDFNLSNNSKTWDTPPKTNHQTFPRPFVFPFQKSTFSAGTRHSLPSHSTAVEISNPASFTYPPPKVISDPPPFSLQCNSEISSSCLVTRGNHQHCRRNSFSSSLTATLANPQTSSPVEKPT